MGKKDKKKKDRSKDLAWYDIQIMHKYKCEKGIDSPARWSCKDCRYYFDEDEIFSRCLKKCIGDWTSYQIKKTEAEE